MCPCDNLAVYDDHRSNWNIVVFECQASLGKGLGHELDVIHAVTLVPHASLPSLESRLIRFRLDAYRTKTRPGGRYLECH